MIKYSKILKVVDKVEAWLFNRAEKQLIKAVDAAKGKAQRKADLARFMMEQAEQIAQGALEDFEKDTDDIAEEVTAINAYRKPRS